ncbi:hypothetical protein GCM10010913_07930 [Paenibacillus aceti]|uniref:Uncharacterized protein n=2 Tax=Paenibacillus TaxID=44249 RepID=A0ABQ1VQ48_9BACL|nr:hypothetical protein GCM10010913_07930 [Paenibacillus aceti]
MKFLMSVEKSYKRYKRLLHSKGIDRRTKMILSEKHNALRRIIIFLYGDFLDNTTIHNQKCVEIFQMNKFSIPESASDLNLPEDTLRKILTSVDVEMMMTVGKSTIENINRARTVWDIHKAMRGFNKMLKRYSISA